ncbi:MAG TPA: ATP-grasp domain-containing protein [Blastocatellia bacterium]|nr:ATP-grasp domain-containing protein [Blastocatellia bacterium]
MMPRVLLLLPTTTYRTKAFLDGATKLGVDIVAASERQSTLAAANPSTLMALDFLSPETSARAVLEFAKNYPIDAVLPVDEDTAVLAAAIAHALGLDHNSVDSTLAAKNKLLMREALKRAGLSVPRYRQFNLAGDVSRVAAEVAYPCVLKPLFLSTSRGVMRVDNEDQFVRAAKRLRVILGNPVVSRRGGGLAEMALAEEFIPGAEVAVEGLLTDSHLRVLAIFDKPDPLDGPFFEETIYVTPSRHPVRIQSAIAEAVEAGARAMGLVRGPIHAELRINEAGPWIVEIAARPIGGLCSRTLRFGNGVSLEELILMHALGLDTKHFEREKAAAGVMMIPIPRHGILSDVQGVAEGRLVPDVEDITITAHLTQELIPPPEGSSYLGFIFSRAENPSRAEAALREAHGKLDFVIEAAAAAV